MSEFNDDFQDVLVENTAQAVLKRLQLLSNARERYKYRWVWELLQNASDSAGTSGVNVAITLKNGCVTFAHSGKPFTNKNIGHLIYHGSTKQGDDEASGRFGTGFMTSHLISKRVRVRGSLVDGRRFDFQLSREGDTADELHKSMDRSRNDFEDSLTTSEAIPIYGTSYEYSVASNIIPDVKKAIDDLKRHAPLVLVFNPRLAGLSVNIDEDVFEVTKKRSTPLRDGFFIHEVGSPDEQNKNSVVCIVTSTLDADVSVGALLRRTADSYMIDIGDDTPRIWALFPMLGTENFPVPVAINSKNFEPTEDRDGVFLWTSGTERTHKNEELIEKAMALCVALAQLSSAEKWIRTDRLARVRPIVRTSWLCQEPFQERVRDLLIAPLRNCPLVLTRGDSYVTSREAALPVALDDASAVDIWKLASDFSELSSLLPPEESVEYWEQVLNEWALTLECDPNELEGSLDIGGIAELVSSSTTIEQLKTRLVDDANESEFLNDLFRLLSDANLEDRFDELCLLPNQNGDLCTREGLFIGQDVSDDLKNIAERMGLAGRSEFLSASIDEKQLQRLLSGKTESELLSESVAELKRRAKLDDIARSEFIEINGALLRWIIQSQNWDALDEFPLVTRDKSKVPENVFRLSTKPSPGVEIPLAPSYVWPEKAVRFADLFPPKLVCADEYQCMIDVSQWSELRKRQFVRVSPLYEVEATVNCFLPDKALSVDEDEVKVESTSRVRVSQIAFFSLRDQGIIDRVRRTRERGVQLVDFICNFILDADKQAFEIAMVPCTDGSSHEYYRAFWLAPLVKRTWISINKAPSRVSAEALGQLLKGHSSILAVLSTPPGRALLSAMRISMADLVLRTLADEEEIRISLMGSISDLARAANGDAERVRRLAAQINEAPELLAELEEKDRVKKQVKRNQAIGKRVQELLEQVLLKAGLSVTPTGVGSDCEVESDWIEDGKEVLIEVKGRESILIEVKSSRATKVGMTVPQAKMATDQPLRFALCVIPLNSEDPTEGEIQSGARFVIDIGERLQNAVDSFRKFEDAQATARTTTADGEIEVDIGESQTRFRVPTELARESGLTFDDFIGYVQERHHRTV